MDYKKLFLEAKASGDWSKVFEIMKAVSDEGDIELTSVGTEGAAAGKLAAEKHNAQRGEHTAYGKPV